MVSCLVASSLWGWVAYCYRRLLDTLSGSLAMSNSKKGVGGLLGLGFQRQSGNFSVGVNTQLTSRKLCEIRVAI